MHRAWVALAAGVIVSGAVLAGFGGRDANPMALGLMGDSDIAESPEASPSPSGGGIDGPIVDASTEIGEEIDGPAVALLPPGGMEAVRFAYDDLVGWGQYTQMGMSPEDLYMVGAMNVRFYPKKDFVRSGGRFRLEFDTTWNRTVKEAKALCTLKGPWAWKNLGGAKDCSHHFATWDGLSIKTPYTVEITAYDTNGTWMQWFGGFTIPDPDVKIVSTHTREYYWPLDRLK